MKVTIATIAAAFVLTLAVSGCSSAATSSKAAGSTEKAADRAAADYVQTSREVRAGVVGEVDTPIERCNTIPIHDFIVAAADDRRIAACDTIFGVGTPELLTAKCDALAGRESTTPYVDTRCALR